VGALDPRARRPSQPSRGITVNPLLAVSQGLLFGIGGVVFIAVFTAALGLAYARFAELDEDNRD